MLLSMLLTLAVQTEGLPQEPTIGFPDLVERVAELDWMLEAPLPGEGVEEFDATQVAAEQPLEFTVSDAGALARLWVSERQGRLELNIDGETVEVYPLNLDTWDAQAEDDRPLWQSAPLMSSLGRGWVSHLPVPFAKSMTLRWHDAPVGARMQLSVRRLGDGVQVIGFTAADLKEGNRSVRRTVRRLNATENPDVPVKPAPFKVGGARKRAPDAAQMTTNGEFRWPIHGHGILRWFELDFIHKEAPALDEELLRSLVLRVEIGSGDLAEPGEVLFRVPLGDFFGSGPGKQQWQSPHMGFNVDKNTFFFRLPIPYRSGLKICVKSDLPGIARFRVRAGFEPRQYATDVPPMLLRAGWIQGNHLGSSEAAVLEAQGPARLAAMSFTATSSSTAPFRHDGPFAFASSWGASLPLALEQVTLWDGPGSFGRSSMIRHFALDAPTSVSGESLRKAAGVLFDGQEEVNYRMFAWWYAPLESTSNLEDPGPVAERLAVPLPEPTFAVTPGAFEGEHAVGILRASNTKTERVQAPMELGFSRSQYLEWNHTKANDNLVLQFPIMESGRYRVALRLATGPERGKVQVFLDGRPMGEVLDLHAEAAGVSEELDLGETRMMPRIDHRFGLRTLDGKPIGLDYFLLEPIVAAESSAPSEETE